LKALAETFTEQLIPLKCHIEVYFSASANAYSVFLH